jgi:MFS family permease
MLALAVVLGMGNALFRPATSALLPALVRDERLTAANALYGMTRDAGQLLGPACAAAVLLFTGPDALLALNATTFIVSALLLTRLRGVRGAVERSGETLLSDTRAGLCAVVGDRMTRTLMCTSGAVVMVAGTMNVAELVLAQRELAAGSSGYALLVCAFGCGLIGGSLLGARDTDEDGLRRRYLLGLVLLGTGLVGSSLAPAVAVAMATFALTGLGNGLFVVSDRVLLQRIVPERLHGRTFGLLDAVDSWGFAGALIAGGALASAHGGRTTFALAGIGTLLVWLTAARVLRHSRPTLRPAFATGA